MMKYLAKKIGLGFVAACAISTLSISAEAGQWTPDGFRGYMVFMASGVLDATNTSPQPGITGCDPMFCDGEYFQTQIMGRSDYEFAEFTSAAKAFFLMRFGLDVDDPANAGRIGLRLFMTNPDWQYRVFEMSGYKVPPQGWRVRDGGYALQVIDPAGVELGGEFAGIHAPQGSLFFYGEYNILTSSDTPDHARKGKGASSDGAAKEVIVLFKSNVPGRMNADGSVALRCDLESDQWGHGFATVTVANVDLGGNRIQGVGRNILTFPPYPTPDVGDADESDHRKSVDDD